MRIDVTVVAAAIVAASVACSDTPTSNKRSSSPQVTVNDNVFTPATVSVPAGDTVIFIWGGSNGHNVVFTTSGAPADCPTYSSGVCIRVFPTVGTFNFVCTYHSGMNGSVIVQQPAAIRDW